MNGSIPIPTALATLFALFAPFVIQFFKKKIEDKTWRWFLAIGLSVIIGVISAFWSKAPFTWVNIAAWIGAVFGYSQTAYNTWKALHSENGTAAAKALPDNTDSVRRRG